MLLLKSDSQITLTTYTMPQNKKVANVAKICPFESILIAHTDNVIRTVPCINMAVREAMNTTKLR